MPPDTRSNLSVRTVPEAANSAAGGSSEEGEWIGRARAGDQAAFRKLVERHSSRAVGLARRMLGSDAEAEEVAQDAFL
ncbi:MAG TPA: sigma factor, partial [Candidatus Limnocylindrales bacterium]|nr:sigma factor [Candidatus Limnocylindrales bacterium]